MCAVKFLRLEEFIEDNRHGIALHMEPQGLLFAEVGFIYLKNKVNDIFLLFVVY